MAAATLRMESESYRHGGGGSDGGGGGSVLKLAAV